MKYIVLTNSLNALSSNQYVNIGDYFQSIAIYNLYLSCGISKSDIIKIEATNLKKFNKEKAVVILQGCFDNIKGVTDIFPIPDNIKTLFLGYHCTLKSVYNEKNVAFFKKNQPIGCRDETTYRLMLKYGVKAFISGCFTLTLPTRKILKNSKVYFVDTPSKLEKFIPLEIKNKITYITHEFLPPENFSSREVVDYFWDKSIKLLRLYSENAALVVTSRLHCVMPCLAMGIPVILVRKYFDDRYSFVDRFLRLYTEKDFPYINWNPDPVNVSDIKNQLIFLFKESLLNFNFINKESINIFYLQRQRCKIKTPIYVRIYKWMLSKFPRVANFLREKVLIKYTVATARKKSIKL